MIVSAGTAVVDNVKFIGYTIESVINYVDEYIVVDHGSTDGTREILKMLDSKYNNLKVLFVDTLPKEAMSKARNIVLDNVNVNADWFWLLDDDEVYYDFTSRNIKQFLQIVPPDIVEVVSERFLLFGEKCNRVRMGRDYRFAARLFRFKDQGLRFWGDWGSYDQGLANKNISVNLMSPYLKEKVFLPMGSIVHAHYAYCKDFDDNIEKIARYKMQKNKSLTYDAAYSIAKQDWYSTGYATDATPLEEVNDGSMMDFYISPFHRHPKVMYTGFDWNNYIPLLKEPTIQFNMPDKNIYGDAKNIY